MNQLHKGLFVHRDIKPDNVFLSVDKDGNIICHLGDFGTARQVNRNMDFELEKNESINNTQAGTADFMSPEMKKSEPNGIKTDSWSLGITIGTMLGLD